MSAAVTEAAGCSKAWQLFSSWVEHGGKKRGKKKTIRYLRKQEIICDPGSQVRSAKQGSLSKTRLHLPLLLPG